MFNFWVHYYRRKVQCKGEVVGLVVINSVPVFVIRDMDNEDFEYRPVSECTPVVVRTLFQPAEEEKGEELDYV